MPQYIDNYLAVARPAPLLRCTADLVTRSCLACPRRSHAAERLAAADIGDLYLRRVSPRCTARNLANNPHSIDRESRRRLLVAPDVAICDVLPLRTATMEMGGAR